MKKRDLEKYFRNQCKQYCFALRKKREVEEAVSKLKEERPEKQLIMVESLLDLQLSEEMNAKYLSQNFSKEELKREKEELNQKIKSCDEEIRKLNKEYVFWKRRQEIEFQEIISIINTAFEYGICFDIQKEEEMICIIKYYCLNQGDANEIVNIENVNISKMEGLIAEFYEAYILSDLDKMMKLKEKYV